MSMSFTSSLDEHIPLIPVFAVPYLLFLPIFWMTVLWAFLCRPAFQGLWRSR